MKRSEYAALQDSEEGWCCDSCYRSALPFETCSSIFSATTLSTSSLDSPTPSTINPRPRHGTGMSLYYANCRSLLPKLDELRLSAEISKPDIIAITETWLDPAIDGCKAAIPSYQLFRRDRNRHGGGICLYIHDSILVSRSFSHDTLEFAHAVIESSVGSIFVGVIYRLPNLDGDLNSLDSLLGSLDLQQYSQVVLIGDFNVDLLCPETSQSADMLGLAASFGLTQVIN